jgi:hypothetical protein
MMANDNPQDDDSTINKGAVFHSLFDNDLDSGDDNLDNT